MKTTTDSTISRARSWLTDLSALKNVFKLVTGTALGQGIAMISSIWVARFYSTEQYGFSATFIALANMLIPLSLLRYDMGIMIADNDEESRSCLLLSRRLLGLFCLSTLVIVAGMYFFQVPSIAVNLQVFIFLIPVVVFIAAYTTTTGLWLNRKRQYNVLSLSKPVSAITAAVISILGGWLSHGNPLWLISSFIASFAVMQIYYSVRMARIPELSSHSSSDFFHSRALLYKYRQFPIYNLPMSIFDHVTKGLPILIFSEYFGIAVAGALAFAYSVVRLPCNVISGSVEQVFMERASRCKEDIPRLRELIYKSLFGLLLVSIPPLLIMSFFGEFIFRTVLRPEWELAGTYAGIVMFAACVSLIVAPIFHVPSILGDQRGQMIFFVISCIMRVIGTFLGVKTGDPKLGIICYVTAEVCCNLIYIFWLRNFINRVERKQKNEAIVKL